MVTEMIKEYISIFKFGIDHVLHPHPESAWQNGDGNVLLLPGRNAHWNALKKIGNHLSQSGYKIHVVEDLKDNKMPVIECAELVEKYIQNKNLKSFSIVAHSKSGLTSKYLLDYSPDTSKKINKIIAIASPFHGTIFSHLGRDLSELGSKSDLLKKLQSSSKNNYKIISIYPKIDNHVIPNSSSKLEGAENIQVDIVGHTNILNDPSTAILIAKYLSN